MPVAWWARGAVSLWLVLLLALALLGGLGAWFWQGRGAFVPKVAGMPGPGRAGGQYHGGAGQAQPVSVRQVRRQDVTVTVPAIGNIVAFNTATVRSKVDGELRRILFAEGQTVRAGQLLAELDPSAYQVALAQAQGQLTRDSAQLKGAQVELARYRALLAEDSIAAQQVDTQQALVHQLQGAVQVDQAQVESARLQLSYTRITAPIGGRLGLRLLDQGNIVRAGGTDGLVSITQTQPVSVVFSVPERYLARIAAKLKAGAPPTVQVWDREQRRQLASGRLISTDNAIDIATGTIKVKARFANGDDALFPNQFVSIQLQLDTLKDALVVPSNAVQRGNAGTYVYVVKDDGTVTLRHIRLGATDGDWVQVRGELTPGERVVTDGADRLREGARVEVIAAPAASVSTPAGAAGAGG